LDFRWLCTHWGKTLGVKLFVGFLALILESYMRRLLQGNLELRHLTFDKLLLELEKIKVVTLSDNRELFIPLTKLQKTILSDFNVLLETL
jgi:hypothetical protein